jgi:hypothetical protein
MDFKKLSDDIYYKSSHYKFAKKPTGFDKGYVKVSDWINELCWHYISRHKELDRNMEEEFTQLIQQQRQKAESLSESAYKKGLLQALKDIKGSS